MSKMVSGDPNLYCVRDGGGMIERGSNRYFVEPAWPLLFGSVGVPNHRTVDPERMSYNSELVLGRLVVALASSGFTTAER